MDNQGANREKDPLERSYIAFISYRHMPLDKKAAELLQRRIERYIVPKGLRSGGEKRLGNVFRDEDELPASSSLTDSITYALDHAEYLLVICTPDLPKSKWCEREIGYFLKTHDRDHILAVLVDGEPEESFSPLLLHTYDPEGNVTGDIEPLAANIVGPDHSIDRKKLNKEIVRIYAALLGCPFDTLWQRERRYRTNRLFALLGGVIAAMAVFMGVVLTKNARITLQNQQISEQNRQISEQNQQITAQNMQISEQNLDLRRQLSRTLVDTGMGQLENYDVRGAVRSALEAVGDADPEIYDHRAEALLSQALGAYGYDQFQSSLLWEQSSDIVDLAVTADGERAVLADQAGFIRCVSTKNGELLWERASWKPGDPGGDRGSEVFLSESSAALICKNGENVMGISLADGAVRWNYRYANGNRFRAISPDGTMFVIMDKPSYKDTAAKLIFLDTATGAVRGSTEIGNAWFLYSSWCSYGSVFTDDGRLFGFSCSVRPTEEDGEEHFSYYVVSTEDWEVHHEGVWYHDQSSHDIFYGLHIDPETEDLFSVQYHADFSAAVVLLFHWENEKEDMIYSLNEIISTDSGWLFLEDMIWKAKCQLFSDHLMLTFNQRSMIIFRLDDHKMVRTLAFNGNILDAFWLDRDKETVEVLLDNGQIVIWDLEHGEGRFFDGAVGRHIDQSDLLLASPVRGGALQNGGMYLTVERDRPGRLLAVRTITDPSGEPVPFADTITGNSGARLSFQTIPGGTDLLFKYQTRQGETNVIKCSSELEEIRRLVIPESFSEAIWALDGDRFLRGFTVWDMDGGNGFLPGMTEERAKSFYSSDVRTERIADGRLLTAAGTYNYAESDWIPCWLDGVPVAAAENGETGIAFRSLDLFRVGGNGCVLGYGLTALEGETGAKREGEEKAFAVFDALSQRRTRLADLHPEAGDRMAALGHREKIFVCADSDGNLCLYDVVTGSGRELDTGYSAGEIRWAVLSDDDRLLLVLTAAGQLDIYSVDSGEMLFSRTLTILKDDMNQIHSMDCRMDVSSDRLYVHFPLNYMDRGYFIAVDADKWLLTAQTDNVYNWDPGRDRIFSDRGDRLTVYDAHHLEDLTAWGRRFLE